MSAFISIAQMQHLTHILTGVISQKRTEKLTYLIYFFDPDNLTMSAYLI